MSLHLGSSKYDEHTVRKGISNRHFDYRVNKRTLSISIPCALSAAQVTVTMPALGTGLPSHATAGCAPINAAPCGRRSCPSLSPARGCRPTLLGPAPCGRRGSIPRPAPSRSPPGKRGCPIGVRISARRGTLPPLGREGWDRCSSILLGKPAKLGAR